MGGNWDKMAALQILAVLTMYAAADPVPVRFNEAQTVQTEPFRQAAASVERASSVERVECRTEYVVLWSTKYEEREEQVCVTERVCEIRNQRLCKPTSRQECHTEQVQQCEKKFKTEYEPFTETECSTKYKQDCQFEWRGHGNDKVWAPIAGTCQNVPYDECKEVAYQECDFVPKKVCVTIPDEICTNQPLTECQDVPKQRCYDQHKPWHQLWCQPSRLQLLCQPPQFSMSSQTLAATPLTSSAVDWSLDQWWTSNLTRSPSYWTSKEGFPHWMRSLQPGKQMFQTVTDNPHSVRSWSSRLNRQPSPQFLLQKRGGGSVGWLRSNLI